jgi:hypothetical protein
LSHLLGEDAWSREVRSDNNDRTNVRKCGVCYYGSSGHGNVHWFNSYDCYIQGRLLELKRSSGMDKFTVETLDGHRCTGTIEEVEYFILTHWEDEMYYLETPNGLKIIIEYIEKKS